WQINSSGAIHFVHCTLPALTLALSQRERGSSGIEDMALAMVEFREWLIARMFDAIFDYMMLDYTIVQLRDRPITLR
uniref:hypothetical protein n=1 Tax=Aeromonas sobria TaxID=646 RepID=UPI0026EF1608